MSAPRPPAGQLSTKHATETATGGWQPKVGVDLAPTTAAMTGRTYPIGGPQTARTLSKPRGRGADGRGYAVEGTEAVGSKQGDNGGPRSSDTKEKEGQERKLQKQSVYLEEARSKAAHTQQAIAHLNGVSAKMLDNPTASTTMLALTEIAEYHLSLAAQMGKVAANNAQLRLVATMARDPPQCASHVSTHLKDLRSRCSVAEAFRADTTTLLRAAINVNEVLIECIQGTRKKQLPPVDAINDARIATGHAKEQARKLARLCMGLLN
jgi:hypothetical protein